MNTRPKRRKSKDNPYDLLNIDEREVYKVSFKDGQKRLRIVKVTKAVYEAFDNFELTDKKQMNEYERHIEYSEIFENNIDQRMIEKPMNLEDEIIQRITYEELNNALDQLSDIQKIRIKKYYFQEKNEYQIAKEENTSQQAISKSIKLSLEKLKEILKK